MVRQLDMMTKQEDISIFPDSKIQSLLLGQRSKTMKDTDPRLKILLSLVFSTAIFFTAQKMTIYLFVIAAGAIMLFSGIGKKSIRFLAAFACFSALDFLTALAGIESVKVLLGVFIYSIMKFVPIIMLGSWLVTTIKVNEFITAMENMSMPRTVVIPLAVLLRFLPTVKEELGYITDTMKMRNIELSLKGMVFQPVRTMEYILVPLLLRSVKLSDELSAAALTRGIDGENRRTSLREVRIFFADAVITGLFVALAAALWYLDHNVFATLPAGRLWL